MSSYPVKERTEYFRKIFSNCDDFTVRNFSVSGVDFALLYIDNLNDREFTCSVVIDPIIKNFNSETKFPTDCIAAAKLDAAKSEENIVEKLLTGSALLLFSSDGNDSLGYIASVRNEGGRSISEPQTENVVRGPREGFVESAPSNAVLIRRRIKSASLKYESVSIGELSKTGIIIMYIDGIVNTESLTILKNRLKKIKTDSVLDSGYIESFISDGRAPFFPTVGNSERPDKVAAKLLEGRIAIICDGSPVVLTVPYLFCESLQSSEDYSKTTYYATFIRFIRLISLILAIYIPAIFCGIMYYHQSVFPLALLLKIESTRKELPFSLFTEIFVILLAFELIREVGVRMPRTVGDAVSIVAGLILSDSAIEAGIASAPVIIVVATAAICNFIVPPYMNQNVIVRLIALVFSRLAGFFGIAIFTAVLILFLCAKYSFGVPYFSPFSPVSGTGLLDFVYMAPLREMKRIPPSVSAKNIRRR